MSAVIYTLRVLQIITMACFNNVPQWLNYESLRSFKADSSNASLYETFIEVLPQITINCLVTYNLPTTITTKVLVLLPLQLYSLTTQHILKVFEKLRIIHVASSVLWSRILGELAISSQMRFKKRTLRSISTLGKTEISSP